MTGAGEVMADGATGAGTADGIVAAGIAGTEAGAEEKVGMEVDGEACAEATRRRISGSARRRAHSP